MFTRSDDACMRMSATPQTAQKAAVVCGIGWKLPLSKALGYTIPISILDKMGMAMEEEFSNKSELYSQQATSSTL